MTPDEGILLLALVVPFGLVFARFAFPGFKWRHVWILTLAASWLIMNFSLWLGPPDNGLAYTVGIFLGWIWLLPVTAGLWMFQALVIHFVPRLPAIRSFQRLSRAGVYGTSAIASILLLYGLFGWIGSEQAIQIATSQLTRTGRAPQSTPRATWSGSRWTVSFDDGSFVEVSRNGNPIGGGRR
jgi:hypothetical protein